jgi:hypothetical protein
MGKKHAYRLYALLAKVTFEDKRSTLVVFLLGIGQ